MTAKEWLKSYRGIDMKINSLCDELEHWKAVATKMTPSSRQESRSNATNDKVGLAVAKIIDLENSINDEINKLVNLRAEIETAIAKVEDERYRVILTERYLNGKKWCEVSKAVHISDMKWLKKLHGRALEKIIFPP